LYLTYVRRVGEEEPLSVVPIAVAGWVQGAIEDAAGLTTGLKWPNDLYVGRRRLAGVPAEARTQAEESYLAVGIGINVLGTTEELEIPNATTIEQETGRRLPLAPLLQTVVDRLDRGLGSPGW